MNYEMVWKTFEETSPIETPSSVTIPLQSYWFLLQRGDTYSLAPEVVFYQDGKCKTLNGRDISPKDHWEWCELPTPSENIIRKLANRE